MYRPSRVWRLGTRLPRRVDALCVQVRRVIMTSMSRTRTVVDAKSHFAQCLREAERGEPVLLSRHGRLVAAIVPIDLLVEVERLRAAGPAAGLASLVGGWEGSEEVAEKALEYGRSAGRGGPELD